MIELFRPSLFKKTFLAVILVLTLGGWSAALVNIYTFKQGYLEDIHHKAAIAVIQIEERLLQGMGWGRPFIEVGSAQNELAGFIFFHRSVKEQFTQIGVVSISGEILSHSNIKMLGHRLPTRPDHKSLRDSFLIQTETSYDVFHPVFLADKLEGYIVIGMTAAPVNQRINEIITRSVVATLLILLVSGVGMFWYLRRVLSRPLQIFEQSVQEIKQFDDLSKKIPVTTQDEIGRLSLTFNSMLSALHHAKEMIEMVLQEAKERESQIQDYEIRVSGLLTKMRETSQQLAGCVVQQDAARLMELPVLNYDVARLKDLSSAKSQNRNLEKVADIHVHLHQITQGLPLLMERFSLSAFRRGLEASLFDSTTELATLPKAQATAVAGLGPGVTPIRTAIIAEDILVPAIERSLAVDPLFTVEVLESIRQSDKDLSMLVIDEALHPQDMLEMIQDKLPDLPIVMLSDSKDPIHLVDYLERGVMAILDRTENLSELPVYLRRIRRREMVLSPRHARHFSFYLSYLARLPESHTRIIPCLFEDSSSKAIAQKAHLTVSTVDRYVQRILESTPFTNRQEFLSFFR